MNVHREYDALSLQQASSVSSLSSTPLFVVMALVVIVMRLRLRLEECCQ